jgi:hypothetical protein
MGGEIYNIISYDQRIAKKWTSTNDLSNMPFNYRHLKYVFHPPEAGRLNKCFTPPIITGFLSASDYC